MVTANLSGVSSSFQTIADDRDLYSMAALAVAGAGGGILATELSDRILPIVGLSANPTGGQSFLANGAFKAVVGFALGYAAIEMGGAVGATLGIAGLGALVVSGADIVSALQALTLQGQQMVSGNSISASGNGTARVVSASNNTGGRSTDGGEDVPQFRSGHYEEMEASAPSTGSGGSPSRPEQFR